MKTEQGKEDLPIERQVKKKWYFDSVVQKEGGLSGKS